jgi:hypothetical protein
VSCKQEFDEKLIYCVHSFPAIYGPSKNSYKDGIAKVNAWNSIATVKERDGKFVVSSVSPAFIKHRAIFYSYCFNINRLHTYLSRETPNNSQNFISLSIKYFPIKLE